MEVPPPPFILLKIRFPAQVLKYLNALSVNHLLVFGCIFLLAVVKQPHILKPCQTA